MKYWFPYTSDWGLKEVGQATVGSIRGLEKYGSAGLESLLTTLSDPHVPPGLRLSQAPPLEHSGKFGILIPILQVKKLWLPDGKVECVSFKIPSYAMQFLPIHSVWATQVVKAASARFPTHLCWLQGKWP